MRSTLRLMLQIIRPMAQAIQARATDHQALTRTEACAHACACVSMHAHACTCVRMHAHACMYTCTCMHACAHAYMCLCTCVYALFSSQRGAYTVRPVVPMVPWLRLVQWLPMVGYHTIGVYYKDLNLLASMFALLLFYALFLLHRLTQMWLDSHSTRNLLQHLWF